MAIAWLLLETVILTAPAEFHQVAIATVVVIIVGIVVYATTGRGGRRASTATSADLSST
jgi:hypothetical protein